MSGIDTTQFVNFIRSDEAIPVACFVSSIALLPKRDLVEHPVGSVFFGVIGSAFVGKMFNWFTPDKMKPYVVVGILGLTMFGLFHRIFHKKNSNIKRINGASSSTGNEKNGESDSPEDNRSIFSSPLINITYTSTQSGSGSRRKLNNFWTPWSRTIGPATNPADESEDMMRVTYTTHRIIDNVGLELTIDKKLNHVVVEELLDENKEMLNQSVVNAKDLILRIATGQNISLMRGLYIHDRESGYLMIKTSCADVHGDVVMSINIESSPQ